MRESFLLLWLACAIALPARGAEPDGPAAREVVAKAASAAFQAGDYPQLEKTADDLRKTKARFPEGVWKLPSFYDGLDPQAHGANPPDWKGWFAKLDAWKAAFPDSPTQPVARAEALVNYGWEARGSGYANTVTSEGWKLLAERLAQARGVLEEAEKLPVRDPHWYCIMQAVAIGRGAGITTATRRSSTRPWRPSRPTTTIISPARPPSCRAGAAGRTPGSTSPRRPPAGTTRRRA